MAYGDKTALVTAVRSGAGGELYADLRTLCCLPPNTHFAYAGARVRLLRRATPDEEFVYRWSLVELAS